MKSEERLKLRQSPPNATTKLPTHCLMRDTPLLCWQCRQLNISPRTLQTLRDNGTLAYSQINHKVFYKPEDVIRIIKPVERKQTHKAV